MTKIDEKRYDFNQFCDIIDKYAAQECETDGTITYTKLKNLRKDEEFYKVIQHPIFRDIEETIYDIGDRFEDIFEDFEEGKLHMYDFEDIMYKRLRMRKRKEIEAFLINISNKNDQINI